MKILYFFLFIFLTHLIFSQVTYAQNNLKTIKDRVRTELMKPQVNERTVKTLITGIKEDGTWPGINY
jgi:hypothetical protein